MVSRKERNTGNRKRKNIPRTGRKKKTYVVASISVVIIVLAGLGSYIAYRILSKPKDTKQIVFEAVGRWNKEADGYRSELEHLLEKADKAVADDDTSAIETLAKQADQLGRELSKLRIRISRAGVPEDADLEDMKNQTTQVISYLVEAVENVQVLPETPLSFRSDFLAQAQRFLVLADTSKVWIDALWSENYALRDSKVLSQKPLINDQALSVRKWSSSFADGLPKELDAWPLDGVPAKLAESEAKGRSFEWVNNEREAAYATEITANISAACAELEIFARADSKTVPEDPLRRALEANRVFANATAKADAPKDSVLTFAAAWRGTRGYHEAFLTGITADSLGDLQTRWTFKSYRLAILAGTSWNQGLKISELRRIPFGYVPSCTGRLEILFLSPWDVRQDLTSVIPGPRAEG